MVIGGVHRGFSPILLFFFSTDADLDGRVRGREAERGYIHHELHEFSLKIFPPWKHNTAALSIHHTASAYA